MFFTWWIKRNQEFSLSCIFRVVEGKQLELVEYVFEKAKNCWLGALCWNWNDGKYLCSESKQNWKLVVDFPWPYGSFYCIYAYPNITEVLWFFYLWMFFFRKDKIRVCSFWEVVLEWVVISLFEYPEQLSITTKMSGSLNKIVLSIKIKQQRTARQLIQSFDLSRNQKIYAIYVLKSQNSEKSRLGQNAIISILK